MTKVNFLKLKGRFHTLLQIMLSSGNFLKKVGFGKLMRRLSHATLNVLKVSNVVVISPQCFENFITKIRALNTIVYLETVGISIFKKASLFPSLRVLLHLAEKSQKSMGFGECISGNILYTLTL